MTVIHQITADLNGTGIMVDITNRVDMTAGLQWTWGRTDWLAPEPTPGTLTLTLDNWDGALTPGSPTGLYTVGAARGVGVYWWRYDPASTRTEGTTGGTSAFTMGPPEVVFPNGSAGSSKVVVQCVDVLAQMALRFQRSMYDEAVLRAAAGPPAAYWPCNEPAGSTQAAEQSGNTGPPLYPNGLLIGWAGGGGPPAAADDPTIYLQSGVTDVANATTWGNYLQTAADIVCPEPAGGTWCLDMWVTADAVTTHSPSSDVMVLAEVVTAQDFTVALCAQMSNPGVYNLFAVTSLLPWNYYNTSGLNFNTSSFGSILPTVRTNFVHWTVTNGSSGLHMTVAVNGAYSVGIPSITLPTPRQPGNRPRQVTVGSAPVTAPPPLVGGVVVDWVGAIGKVALYGRNDTTTYVDLTNVGLSGTRDGPSERLDRLLASSGIPGLAAVGDVGSGTPLLYTDMELEAQATAGQNLLTSAAVTMAGEGANLVAHTYHGAAPATWAAANTQLVQPFWRTPAIQYAPTLVVDVEGQAFGVPPMSKDTAGVVASATASSRTGTATFTDPVLAAQLGPTSASIAAAYNDPAELAAVAQERVLAGRAPTITATAVTIDVLTSPPPVGGWLAATIWGGVPGARLRLTGLPPAVLGYGQADMYICGGQETWTVDRAEMMWTLHPADTPVVGYTAPETSGRLPGLPDTYWRTSGDAVMQGTLTSSTASAYVSAGGGPLFSTDPADYPLLLRIGQECVSVAAPPVTNDATHQTFAIVRGAATTNPRPHRYGEPVDVWLAPTVTR